MSDLDEMFSVLKSCCLHDPQWHPEDVDKEIAWGGDHATGSESESVVIVKLKDNNYGLLTQGEDYTGHGCQCDSMTVIESSLYTLLGHLNEHEILMLLNSEDRK
jgi:hypothetical protein